MPQKSAKQPVTNRDKKKSNIKKNVNKKETLSNEPKNKKIEKEESKQKIVVKMRKKELTPTKASATAIISQANRAKKQALIKKLTEEEKIPVEESEKNSQSSKVPLRVRIFFWCSLLLFCISFYHAIIRPQLEQELVDIAIDDNVYWNSDTEKDKLEWDVNLSDIDNIIDKKDGELDQNSNIIRNPQNADELIQSYFAYMSEWKFDESFALFDNKAQNDKNIRDHFSAFRMSPFFEWIEWKSIIPQNIQKTSETYKWKDVYTFDISYKLASTNEQYNETWKFAINDNAWNLKIMMLYCVSNGCWKHPIFWPEDFGLMR